MGWRQLVPACCAYAIGHNQSCRVCENAEPRWITLTHIVDVVIGIGGFQYEVPLPIHPDSDDALREFEP